MRTSNGLIPKQDFSKTEVSNISPKAIKIHFDFQLFGILKKESGLGLNELKGIHIYNYF